MLRYASVITDASKLLNDPLVQLDLILNATRVLAHHKLVTSRREFENLISKLVELTPRDACLWVILSFEKRTRGKLESRLLVCNGVVVACTYVDETKSESLAGEDALTRLLEVLATTRAVVDAYVVPRSKLPSQLAAYVEKAERAAALPAGRPPLVWIGVNLYGFRVERVAGEGGISYVLEAYGPRGRVALKILRERSRFGSALAIGNPGAIETFARTGTAMMRLTYPSKSVVEAALEERGVKATEDRIRVLMGFSENVIRVYGVYVPRDEYKSLEEYIREPPTMVMEFVEGQPLNKVEKALSAFEARKIIYEVAGALALAHLHGFGHFDVKPQNVLVERVGGFPRAKLFDFTALPVGLRRAPVLEEITPEYTDPYAILHGVRAYPNYDVYSLGLLAYRLLYKRPPYARIALNYVVLRKVIPTLAEKIRSYLPAESKKYIREFEKLAESKRDPESFLRAAQDILDAVEPLTPPPGQPQSLVFVLRRMLALTPDERYSDALEVVRELATYFNVTI